MKTSNTKAERPNFLSPFLSNRAVKPGPTLAAGTLSPLALQRLVAEMVD